MHLQTAELSLKVTSSLISIFIDPAMLSEQSGDTISIGRFQQQESPPLSCGFACVMCRAGLPLVGRGWQMSQRQLIVDNIEKKTVQTRVLLGR